MSTHPSNTGGRQKAEFFRPDVDGRIARMRYNHHRQRVQEALKSVYNLRKEIGTARL